MQKINIPDEVILHQLAIDDIGQAELTQKPINYRRGKRTRYSSMLRLLCGQYGIRDQNELLDALVVSAFEKYFEGNK